MQLAYREEYLGFLSKMEGCTKKVVNLLVAAKNTVKISNKQ